MSDTYDPEPNESPADGEARYAQTPESKAKADSTDNLNAAESNPGGDKLGMGYRPDKGKSGGLQGLRKRKALIVGAAAGSGALLILLIILIFFLGSLVIPNFSEDMIAWQFARVTRETIESNTEVTAEKLVVDSSSDAATEATAAAEGDAVDPATKVNAYKTLTKIFRPQKIINTMEANGDLQYIYGKPSGILRRSQIDKVVIGGKSIDIPRNTTSTLDKIINPYDYVKRTLQFRQQFNASLQDALGKSVGGTNLMPRLRIAKLINAKLDIKQFRWGQKELDNTNQETSPGEADVTNLEDSYNIATDNGQAAGAASAQATGDEQSAAQQADEALQQCVGNKTCATGIIKSGGLLPDSVVSVLNKVFNPNLLKGAIRIIGPTYAIAAPLCMIYNASIVNSGPLINGNLAADERTGYSIASAGDQQKAGGNNVNPVVLGALERQMNGTGGISRSNVIKRDSNLSAPTGGSGINPEVDGTGNFQGDIFDFLGPGLDGALTHIIHPTCDVFDNVWTGATIGVAAILIPGLTEALDGATDATVSTITSKLLTSVTNSIGNLFSRSELLKLAGVAGATVAGAYLAKYIAIQNLANPQNNAIGQDETYDNTADAGMNAYANDVDRQQNYGVALSPQSTAQLQTVDTSYLAQQEKSQSTFQRYFALNNPTSLADDLATNIYARVNITSFATLLQSAARALNPLSTFSGLIGMIQNKTFAAAAATTDSTDYGIVQFGWTPIEDDAYLHSPQYSMLNNQTQLAKSGQWAQIASKYEPCFQEQVGTLLAAQDIQRQHNGNIVPNTDAGLCAPDNLGPTSQDSQGNLKFATPEASLVFRYRVAMRNENSLNQQVNMQTITAD